MSQFTRWSHAERLLALDQLIDNCEPQQVRHMMQVQVGVKLELPCLGQAMLLLKGFVLWCNFDCPQVIEPQFQRDFISLLPKELAL